MTQSDLLIGIQSVAQPWLDRLMIGFSFVGDEKFFLALIPFLYLLLHRRTAVSIAVLMALSVFFNEALKAFYQAPRPIGSPGIRSLYTDSAPGYSFPSGHSQGTATFWGYCATVVKKKWFYWLAALMTLTIMFSRMYLGVHWPIDVAAGLVFGLLVVSLFHVADGMWRKVKPSSFSALLFMLAVVTVLLLLFHEESGRQMMGFMSGAWAGYLLEKRHIGMILPAAWTKRLLPTLIGGGAVVVIFLLLMTRLPPGAPWDFLSFLVLGLAGTYGEAWLVTRLGWYRGNRV